jgi:hypothetical protein
MTNVHFCFITHTHVPESHRSVYFGGIRSDIEDQRCMLMMLTRCVQIPNQPPLAIERAENTVTVPAREHDVRD